MIIVYITFIMKFKMEKIFITLFGAIARIVTPVCTMLIPPQLDEKYKARNLNQ